jgi:hypothetical protein
MTWTRGPFGGEKDPQFSLVQLLCNGTGSLTTDHSSFSRAMTAFGGMALDSGVTLFGNNTYKAPTSGSSSWLRCDSVTWAGSFGTAEWCIEGFYYPTSDAAESAIHRLGLFTASRSEVSGKLIVNCSNLNTTSYSLDSNAALALSTWYYYAFVRDNSGAQTALRMYFGQPGGNASQSGAHTGIPLTDAVGAPGSLNEAFGLSLTTRDHGRFGPFRFTIGNARYYNGTSFAVPSAAFPTQ